MIIIEIIDAPVVPFISHENQKEKGAELIFNGRVRETEHGKKIKYLEYEQYEGMAEDELKIIAKETQKKYPITQLL